MNRFEDSLTATEILGKASYNAKQLRISMGTAFVNNTGMNWGLKPWVRRRDELDYEDKAAGHPEAQPAGENDQQQDRCRGVEYPAEPVHHPV